MNRWIWLGALLALWNCGQDPQSGGGGIEIPNGLSLTVNQGDNRPASGVAVRLLARESWTRRTLDGAAVVLDSAVTDSLGAVHFDLPAGEGYWVEAQAQGLGMRLWGVGPEHKVGYLSKLSRLNGVVGSGAVAGVRVRLAGSTRTAITDDQGRFEFDSLPQADYAMVAQTQGSGKLASLGEIGVGALPELVSGLVNDTGELILDNFADANNDWALRAVFGSGYWWITAKGAVVTDVFGIAGTVDAIKTGGGEHWMAITVDAAALGTDSPWAGLGLDLGPIGGGHPDLSRAQAFALRLRGQGAWTFKVIEERAGVNITWSMALPVVSAWGAVQLSTSALVCESNPLLVWKDSPRRIRQVLFETGQSGSLELGKLAVEGASLADWAQ